MSQQEPSLAHHHPAGLPGLPISLLSSLSCRHRRGHVPADLQTEHFVFLQRANPATWKSAFCLPVTQPACPILCRHGSSFSCHLHRKRTDKHSVSDWGQLAGSCLPHSAPSPLLSLGSKHCLSSVEGHCLARKGNCAACHPAPVGLCSLYCTFAKYTSVTVANSWSGNIKYAGFFHLLLSQW